MLLQASVILSTGGGVCLSAYWDATPPQSRPPRTRYPPGADTPGPDTPPRPHPPGADTPPQTRHPPEQTPPGPDTPLDQTPPPEADASIRSMSGRYASYWNAFLFVKVSSLFTSSIPCVGMYFFSYIYVNFFYK